MNYVFETSQFSHSNFKTTIPGNENIKQAKGTTDHEFLIPTFFYSLPHSFVRSLTLTCKQLKRRRRRRR